MYDIQHTDTHAPLTRVACTHVVSGTSTTRTRSSVRDAITALRLKKSSAWSLRANARSGVSGAGNSRVQARGPSPSCGGGAAPRPLRRARQRADHADRRNTAAAAAGAAPLSTHRQLERQHAVRGAGLRE